MENKYGNDKLDNIVKNQKELMEQIFNKRGDSIDFLEKDDVLKINKDPLHLNKALKNHVLAINDELAELQRELDWKWWTNKKKIHRDNINEELIDIIFFTIQALIINGNDAKDIFNLYMDKLQENLDRQEGKTTRKGYNFNSDEYYENVD